MVDIISPLYRFLAEGEVIVATDEHIRDDGSTWEPVNSWAVGMEYPSKVFKSIRRIAQPAQSWQPIETAPKDKTNIIVAAPTEHLDDYIVGEAYFDPEHHNGGDWWWAGTGHEDYFSGPISDVNYHLPTHWQPLPVAPPITPTKGGDL